MTRNTVQKEIIHQTLCEMRNHPTAAMVYERVHRTHPTISRSTVFRVLGQMADAGRVLRLTMDGCDIRYDGDLTPHSHVCCRRCGAVADLPWTKVDPPEDTAGFLLEKCLVEYQGLCPACRERESEKPA
jgi:Fe2+ or Zn2+ uptake regulation protein